MRVLHVTDCYLPRLGGIEVHLHDLVTRQREAGLDARVVTVTPQTPDTEEDDDWVVRVGGGSELAALIDSWRPDVVHVHVSVFSPFATQAARRACRSGLPTLVTVHSMWSRLGPLPAVARTLLALDRWPMVWSAVSDAAARPLREMLGPDTDVAVLPNAVDPARWTARSVRSGTDPVTLVSVMRFTRTKRALPLARMLRAVREAVPAETPIRAVVVGDGPQHEAFTRYVRRHGMADWVDLPGRLDRSEVRDRLDRADCFVAPAELESFGIAALEARAVGLPVVASAHAGVGEFVRHGREGLLARDDVAMVAAISRMVTDRGLREAIAAHNAGTPVEHDWAAAGARTDELYLRAARLAGAVRRRTAPRLVTT
ncbi:glycosyltransferase family 4 protein [Nocardioides mangrovi]|uniref:Glycosyltransferase family 4 protein n=1 Tax=Nocardioides mangrovi TaxID=2874580 RepID=A0ABS7U8X5_9ACTN|nr:glycosyltransferase family 4 protein [Nocardioides mangrovi]MBZ5737173.1 glycosyltransferase family 4 protein [Nocardioides mangrovi]